MMKRFLIAPSIISANFAKLGEELDSIIAAGIDLLHFDVMDNHYVPNLSIGPMVLRSLLSYGINVPVDVHLMVEPIDRLVSEFAAIGVKYISFHPEAVENVGRSLEFIRDCGCKSGLVLNLTTELDFLDSVIDTLDLIVLMSVNPGFSGQPFMFDVLNRIVYVRKLIDGTGLRIDLAVDGGINMKNIGIVASAGANMFIVGSAIFESITDYSTVICGFRSILSNL